MTTDAAPVPLPIEPDRPAVPSSRRRLIGAGLCVVSGVSFSTLPILAKLAFASGIGLTSMLAARLLGAAFLLWPYLALTRRRHPLPGYRRGLVLFALGVGFAMQAALYFSGLGRIPASIAALLVYAYPALVALMPWAVNRRPPGRSEWTALALALTGVMLTVGANTTPSAGALDPIGVALVLCGSLGYAAFITASSVLTRHVDALVSTAYVVSGAGASFAAAAWLGRSWVFPCNPFVLRLMAAMVVISTIVAMSTLIAGIARVGPTAASLLSTLEPLAVVVLAAVFLGERLTSTQVLGGALILGAVILVSLGTRAAEPQAVPPR